MSDDQEIYIAAEPDEEMQTVYVDVNGEPHITREDALAANVENDCLVHLLDVAVRCFPSATADERVICAAIMLRSCCAS